MVSPDKLARRIDGIEREVRSLATQPRLKHSSIDDGALELRDIHGNTAGYIGTQFDGTVTAASVGGTWPASPFVPLVTPIPGGLRVYWDGTYWDESFARMDFRRVTVHAVTDVDHLDPLDQTQIVGEMTSATGGEITVSLPIVEHFVALVAWTDAGKFSEPSEPGFGTPLELFDEAALDGINAEIAALNAEVADAPVVFRQPEQPVVEAGKKSVWFDTDADNVPHFYDGAAWTTLLFGEQALAANAVVAETIATGALDGKVITGALIQTALAEEFGIKLIDNNFIAYDPTGTPTFVIDGDTGQVTLADALVAGGEVSGASITGGVITGATYRSSVDGNRVEISEHETVVNNAPYYYGMMQFFSGNPDEVTPPRLVTVNNNRLQISSGKFNPSPDNVSYVDLMPSSATVRVLHPAGSAGVSVASPTGGADGASVAVANRGNSTVNGVPQPPKTTVSASGTDAAVEISGQEKVDVKSENILLESLGVGQVASFVTIRAKDPGTPKGSKVVIDAPSIEFVGDVVVAPGMIMLWPGATLPGSTWQWCRGLLLPTVDYPKLFAAIGYAYGGSGNSFALPNFNGRSPIGVGGTSGTGSTNNYSLGTKWGDERMEAHTHRQRVFLGATSGQDGGAFAGLTSQGFGDNGSPANQFTDAQSGGIAHGMGNVHPVLGVNFIIKIK